MVLGMNPVAKRVYILGIGLACLLSACAPAASPTPVPVVSAPTPTQIQASPSPVGVQAEKPADITGVWAITFPDYKPAYLLFRADGTYAFAPNPDGSHGQSGQYWFTNGVLHIQNDICGQESQYTVIRQDKNGQPALLLFTPVQAPCPALTTFFTQPPPAWVGPLQ